MKGDMNLASFCPRPATPRCARPGIGRSVDPDQRERIARAVSLAIIPRRTNVSTYDLMVITAVLLSFASSSAVLAFATFDESRRHRSR